MNRNGLDKRSFILGMITAFSECVAGGCKRLAFSPPMAKEDYELVSNEAADIIEKHGLIHYHERNLDQPEETRVEWILIAAGQSIFDQYLQLRSRGFSPMESLQPLSELLSYNPEESVHTGYDAYKALFPRHPADTNRGK